MNKSAQQDSYQVHDFLFDTTYFYDYIHDCFPTAFTTGQDYDYELKGRYKICYLTDCTD